MMPQRLINDRRSIKKSNQSRRSVATAEIRPSLFADRRKDKCGRSNQLASAALWVTKVGERDIGKKS